MYIFSHRLRWRDGEDVRMTSTLDVQESPLTDTMSWTATRAHG